jgi:hypothetical protein
VLSTDSCNTATEQGGVPSKCHENNFGEQYKGRIQGQEGEPVPLGNSCKAYYSAVIKLMILSSHESDAFMACGSASLNLFLLQM